jgi:hypothetical protein
LNITPLIVTDLSAYTFDPSVKDPIAMGLLQGHEEIRANRPAQLFHLLINSLPAKGAIAKGHPMNDTLLPPGTIHKEGECVV